MPFQRRMITDKQTDTHPNTLEGGLEKKYFCNVKTLIL